MNESINHQPAPPEVVGMSEASPRDGPAAMDIVSSPEVDQAERPRIWVASLADYNAGHLHGRWIDAGQLLPDLETEVAEMLAESRELVAEEHGIFDYEGFGPVRIDEYESLEMVNHVAQGIVEHGPAFAHWASVLERSEWEDRLDAFEEHYQGHWSSMTEFAEQLLDDLGIDIGGFGPENLQAYISFDVEAFARDLSMDYRIDEGSEGVHVFYW